MSVAWMKASPVVEEESGIRMIGISIDESHAIHNGILEQARAALDDCRYAVLSHVRCQFNRDELELVGDVPDFFLNDMAERIVRSATGYNNIVNSLEVCVPY